MIKTGLHQSAVKELEEFAESVREVFKLKNDEDHVERIALKITEMV